MAFTAKTTNSAAAWRPDVFAFSPADIIPEALVIQCATLASNGIPGTVSATFPGRSRNAAAFKRVESRSRVADARPPSSAVTHRTPDSRVALNAASQRGSVMG